MCDTLCVLKFMCAIFSAKTKIMQPVPRDLLEKYVQGQYFPSTAEIMAPMKEMFWNVMKVEIDEEFGRGCSKTAEKRRNPED